LTASGALGAAVLGTLTVARGGAPATAALLAFFVSSSALSRIGQAHKAAAPRVQEKGAQRDLGQVLANGGTAGAALLFGGAAGRTAFVGSLAAAAADTWATELGMLAGGTPRLVTTGLAVPPGTSGGVTGVGWAASAGGALTVGLAWRIAGGDARGLWTALVAGLLGSLVDSLLGALVQAVYRCPDCGATIETSRHDPRHATGSLIQGVAGVSNDVVNLGATLSGAVAGALLGRRSR
jgi:uncharacterized protein (TIGR00297 family)